MGTTSYKAAAKYRQLVDNLKKFLTSTPVLVETSDTDGNPVATFSADATPAAGEKVIVIRVMPIQRPTAQDSLGLTGMTPSGHVYQICTEAASAGDIVGAAELTPVLVEVGRCGSFVEWYQSANGTLPAVAQMTSGNLVGKWRDLYWNALKAD